MEINGATVYVTNVGHWTMASPLQPTNAPITNKLALSFCTASGQGSTHVMLLASTLMMPDGVL
jgi:hypothetical protein